MQMVIITNMNIVMNIHEKLHCNSTTISHHGSCCQEEKICDDKQSHSADFSSIGSKSCCAEENETTCNNKSCCTEKNK